MKQGYSEEYYKQYDIGSKTVSYIDSIELRQFHATVAKKIIADFHPKTVLDAGCAMGVLVSELKKLGVQAYGIDYSEYAVENADPFARDTCYQGSLATTFPEVLPKHFDLVTCMEVLEHMSQEEGRKAIANICKVTDVVVFCSSPDDYEDPTHINLQEREYWATCFAENGFFDDLDYRPLYITDYAVCYRRKVEWIDQIANYERYVRITDKKLHNFRNSHYKALEAEHEKAVAEWTKTANDLHMIHQELEKQRLTNQQMADQYQALDNEHKKAVAEWTKTANDLKDLQSRSEQLTYNVERTEYELENASLEIEFLKQENAELTASHQRYEAEYNYIKECLAQSEAMVLAIETSISWKVTAPFRHVMHKLRRFIGKAVRKAYRSLKKVAGRKRAITVLQNSKTIWPPVLDEKANAADAVSVPTDCRRLAIYALYDKDGFVDEYIIYFLTELSKWVERTLVVINGSLDPKGKEALTQLGCEVVCRENEGFDAWGIKTGIDYLGFDTLKEYDEVVIANNTIFGPVCDLAEMFHTMAARKLDLWGINSHPGMPELDPFKCNPYGYIPEHIQSFFYVVRKRLIQSEAFRKFWTQLPELQDYNAAVGLYETVMTRFYEDSGYVWGCYMDCKAYYDMTDNPLIAMPMEAIRDWNCPFFKRRAFFQDYDYLTTFTGQQTASCLKQYIEENTDYPFELVWKNLIRTCHMSDLTQNMHLSRIFDKDNTYAIANEKICPEKVALFMHIYDHTMADELVAYASAMPAEADIFISTTSEEKRSSIKQSFIKLPNRVEVRVLPNRGRDVSALLASFKDVVMDYDVACVTHDKKTGYLKPQTVGEGFAYMGYENILGSKAFVLQVIQAFREDSYLGLLYAPEPNHADFATHVGLEWGANFACTKALAVDLKLCVPMDEKHPPMAPYGSSFWFRTKAMEPLFAKDWTYEDFPPEPFNMTDGSILHAIERIYPYVAQHAGYYSALLMTADYAAVDVGNLYYYAQQYAHVCAQNGITNQFIAVRDICDMRLTEQDGVTDMAMSLPHHKPLLRRFVGKLRRVLGRWANE